MGSNRKRPADRSPTPTKEGSEGQSKKKKKAKKAKQNKESGSEPKNHGSSLESTATAEGKIMAQVCSTFSRLEQSRFEAFRRATFASDAISTYVAQCLIHEHSGEQGSLRRAPILSEVCAPGQAEEIAVVVSTLAKAYAQRLVTAAKSLSSGYPRDPIGPEQIMEAFKQRQAKGADPGFFLQSNSSSSSSSSYLQKGNESYEKKRLAALKAQEDYDKLYPPVEVTEEEGGEDSMDISTPVKEKATP